MCTAYRLTCGSPCSLNRHSGQTTPHPSCDLQHADIEHRPAAYLPYAITDVASPLVLRSTRSRLRTAMHRRCQSVVVEGCRDDGAGVRSIDGPAGALARDLPETALREASHCPTTRLSAALLTCSVAWVGEAAHGDVNHPRINGMQGVRGSNPLSSTRHNVTSTSALSVICQRFARVSLRASVRTP